MEAFRARATLFALLSSIEDDLRTPIIEYFSGHPSETILDAKLLEKCANRKAHANGNSDTTSIQELIVFSDLGDLTGVLNANKAFLPEDLSKYVKDKTPLIEKLVPVRNRVYHIRPLEDGDWHFVSDEADQLIKENKNFWATLDETLTHLRSDPTYALKFEIPAWATHAGNCTHTLPLPDFDETTLIGREQEVKDLLRLCQGGYPVISIIGDGGLGKTALALKVAYDLLDSEPCPFDLIVWTTAKTARLGPTEILSIHDAISDSVSMIENIRVQVAGGVRSNNDPVEEILAQLKDFRILLVLDNLETVLDDYIRDFMQRLPQSRSKILITSRIGLGIENKFKLQPLTLVKAKHLFRKLVKERKVEALENLGDKKIEEFCHRAKNSPGFIKWFVSAVQAGARPEDVLALKATLFLDYCMSNVYQYLSPDCHRILKAMLCSPTARSQPELSFLLPEMEIMDLKNACQELEGSNMVTMQGKAEGAAFVTNYQLTDLARQYLKKRHAPTEQDAKYFLSRERLRATEAKRFEDNQKQSKYIWFTISTRSSSDFITAKHLLNALIALKTDSDEAELQLNKAADLDPEYFEVYRVRAIIAQQQNDFFLAKESFEEALAREPKSAPLYFWYGDFLRKKTNDIDAAMIQYKKAVELAPTDYEPLYAASKGYRELGDLGTACSLVACLTEQADLEPWKLLSAWELHIDLLFELARKASTGNDSSLLIKQLLLFQGEYKKAVTMIGADNISPKLLPLAKLVEDQVKQNQNPAVVSQLNSLLSWAINERKQPLMTTSVLDDSQDTGEITNLPPKIARKNLIPGYGFIRAKNGDSLHFWSSQLRNQEEWLNMQLGDIVTFIKCENEKGFYARDIKLKVVARQRR